MDTESEERSASQIFRDLRSRMQWSRGEVASFLGVSRKAVESYEQGWRAVPDRVWKQLITTVALQHEYPLRQHSRCWELTGCPRTIRDECFSYQKMHGHFCWMTATNNCRKAHLGAERGYLECVNCPVTLQFLPPLEPPPEEPGPSAETVGPGTHI